ncbi:MAG: trigger factor [Candidatus Limnocylindria bacterium]
MPTDPSTTTAASARTSAPDGSFRYSVTRHPGSLVTIDVEADAARLAAASDRVFAKRNRQASIPGFRPGKATRAMYERHYGAQHLWTEAAEDVIDETYREVVQAERLDPLEHPRLEITQLEPAKDLRYVASVTVRPGVKLGDYAAHGAKVEPAAPTDEDVERVIAGMREHHAELRPVDRPAASGDVLTVDVDAVIDGKALPPMGRNAHIELGNEYSVPGLAEGLVGIRAGEERTLDLTFPADHPDEDMRGKAGKFTVRVSAVAEKILPPLDEELAKTVGVADLATLRRAVRDELAHGAFHEARDSAADKALGHALDASEVEVPEVLARDELDHMLADLRARAAERGLAWERFLLQAKKTEGEIREEWRPAALRRAKSLLVLDAIAERESVSVSSTELAQELALMPVAKKDPQVLRSPQVLASLARSMRNRKTIDKLIGLEGADAEREVLRQLGASPEAGAHGADVAKEAEEKETPESAAPAAQPAPEIVVAKRPDQTQEGREAIRSLLEKKE